MLADAIIAKLGTSNAASLCRAYTGGGFSDWSLPSAAELQEMLKFTSVIGMDPAKCYWSSTEQVGSYTFGNSGASYGCLQGGGGVGNKDATNAAHAVRSF